MKKDKLLVALAGQPNCGKSTVFNALTGASQHVANYPGVTVEKMTGSYMDNGQKIEVVDLPGTYSLTSYSPEERVSRDFLLHETPSVVVNVADASNLKRNLYFTLQLLEMKIPVVLELNMMDVAKRRNIEIDVKKLSQKLGASVVPTVIKTGKGKKRLLRAITAASDLSSDQAIKSAQIDYGHMEPFIDRIKIKLLEKTNFNETYPLGWLSIKLMEGDSEAEKLIAKNYSEPVGIIEFVKKQKEAFEAEHDEASERHIASCRYRMAEKIVRSCIKFKAGSTTPLSEKADRVLCNRYLGIVILIGVIYLLYYLSIVQGYKVTSYTWPILAKLRSIVEAILPDPGFIDEPLIRSLSLWFVDSINALLNYIPIFFILFGLIAILEDSGYMPRMAFILDRLFQRFGLHGQSTLAMVLGGIYVGGCAVPGVMATKGIPDEKSRMATIMIIPLLNCMAKVPLYILLINIYFSEHKGLAMFFIATISLLIALPVSKILTLTLLKNRETSPFIMEMPAYHIPTIRGVLGRAVERVWIFIKKIITIVAVICVVVFVLLQFPGLSIERQADYTKEKEQVIAKFYDKIEQTGYAAQLRGENLMALVLYWDAYKNARMRTKAGDAVAAMNKKFKKENSLFFKIIRPGKEMAAKTVNRAFRKLFKTRKRILREIRREKIDNSFLGQLGKKMEPVTKWAGFNWRINVSLLSAFAAKESSVATLGSLYQQETEGESLEKRMKRGEAGFTSLHALALMLFMVLYPPCIATTIMIKLQTGSFKWMLFSMIYPIILGLIVAVMIFTGGNALGLNGLQAMFVFYALALTTTVATGFVKSKSV